MILLLLIIIIVVVVVLKKKETKQNPDLRRITHGEKLWEYLILLIVLIALIATQILFYSFSCQFFH